MHLSTWVIAFLLVAPEIAGTQCTAILVQLFDGDRSPQVGDVVDEEGHALVSRQVGDVANEEGNIFAEADDHGLQGMERLEELAALSTIFLRDHETHQRGQVAPNSAFEVEAAFYLPNLNVGILHACRMIEEFAPSASKELSEDEELEAHQVSSNRAYSYSDLEEPTYGQHQVESEKEKHPVLEDLVEYLSSLTSAAGLDREDRFLV
eukprot:Gregarina_sp_Poly_1__3864@NODE_2154_length_2589_cov_46_007137_g1388_i0_p3_GENE_NODE_2154_length_2589_cov_46_007137_g1388_i0NODE_2154_length_2589_cov_46_007137_g1388_i0_p3_ORF_typecomplete_len207_score27_25_NODE_2154_length_2589_cov_46_007137_g1388_i0317937